jgi:hypothetical protein
MAFMTIARKFLQVVAFICTLIVGVTAMAVIVSQTTWFKEWLRGFIVRQADDYVNGRLTSAASDGICSLASRWKTSTSR